MGVVGSTMATKEVPGLIPGPHEYVTLPGKRDLQIDLVKDLEVEDFPGLPGWA